MPGGIQVVGERLDLLDLGVQLGGVVLGGEVTGAGHHTVHQSQLIQDGHRSGLQQGDPLRRGLEGDLFAAVLHGHRIALAVGGGRPLLSCAGAQEQRGHGQQAQGGDGAGAAG